MVRLAYITIKHCKSFKYNISKKDYRKTSKYTYALDLNKIVIRPRTQMKWFPIQTTLLYTKLVICSAHQIQLVCMGVFRAYYQQRTGVTDADDSRVARVIDLWYRVNTVNKLYILFYLGHLLGKHASIRHSNIDNKQNIFLIWDKNIIANVTLVDAVFS